MKIIVLLITLVFLCYTVESMTVISDFDVKGNGTVMQHSYFKEPKLEENAYTAGYKAGSLNYLENGEITLNDSIEFYDGLKDGSHNKIDSDLNSTLVYEQQVNFKGDKGISEFYGKGFFPNNRAVSAWKKIRYDDLTYNKSYGVIHLSGSSRIAGSGNGYRLAGSYDLGDSYGASKIDVNAILKIGPDKGLGKNDYEVTYNATVEDGVIEIRDATGWTNRTGSRRIDWERDSLMRGNFSITNNLYVNDLFFPEAGLENDWLPCCIGGDIEKIIEKANDDWPNRGTYATLDPKKLLPTKIRTQNCTIVYDHDTGYGTECNNLSYDKFDCTEPSCPGFECIYQFDGPIADEEKPELTESIKHDLTVRKIRDYGNSEGTVEYKIIIQNRGTISEKNVIVLDILPSGMHSGEKDTKWTFYRTESEETEQNPRYVDMTPRQEHSDSNPALNITWRIGELGAEEGVTIELTSRIINDSANDLDNMVYVTYDGMDPQTNLSAKAKPQIHQGA